MTIFTDGKSDTPVYLIGYTGALNISACLINSRSALNSPSRLISRRGALHAPFRKQPKAFNAKRTFASLGFQKRFH